MSQELTINFENQAARDQFMERLAKHSMRVRKGNGVLLKDPMLGSSADYDIGVVALDACGAYVEILFKSVGLYKSLASAIGDFAHQCLDETDEQVLLEDIFRVQGQA
jgi:hypothetical protein